ncbi:MAG TPA: hypothetical protein PLA01_05270 [Acetivibrio sp.]|nr:hypothetical protein [Acetivibrio sp.]
MNDDILKNIVKTKLSLIDTFLGLLPGNIKSHVEDAKKSILEAACEYLQTGVEEKKDNEKGITKISIE